MMGLTRDFKLAIKDRAARDARFRKALFTEAVQEMLNGDAQAGRAVLRNYINATIGFEHLANRTGTPAKSLMRMFGPKGNPRADNLFLVLKSLQDETGIQLEVKTERQNVKS